MARRLAHSMKGVAGGRSEFYRMDASLAFVENKPWWVKQQASWGWNEHNKEKAKRLLQEAGYKGEPVRFLATQEYKWSYDFAILSKQQLEDVGFNIDLQVVDWATLVKRRNNPKEYDAFTTGTGNIFEPTAFTVLSCSWPGWTCDADIQGLLQEMGRETDQKKRYALWERMAARGPGVWNVILALSLVYMPRTALLVRSTVLSLRELDYVAAARALGRPDFSVAFRHILPNCLAPLLVQGTFIFAYAVLAEAILGFLGVGVPPYVPSWGNVIASGKNVIREAFWVSLFPGITLTVAGLSLNLLGDGLRDTLDPRLRGSVGTGTGR